MSKSKMRPASKEDQQEALGQRVRACIENAGEELQQAREWLGHPSTSAFVECALIKDVAAALYMARDYLELAEKLEKEPEQSVES